ncbi:MAG: carboxymuconolactone decarboxylase family protein [Firmicutes bacterium]|jgi:AhpD family alkylhydroperoxidase|nr:carboxymuconolactone decarboxylase family protein [Bacillota bacterium]
MLALHGNFRGGALKGRLPRSLVELIKIRVSQLNGCACCHSRGPATGRKGTAHIASALWRETPFFTEAERVAPTRAEM